MAVECGEIERRAPLVVPSVKVILEFVGGIVGGARTSAATVIGIGCSFPALDLSFVGDEELDQSSEAAGWGGTQSLCGIVLVIVPHVSGVWGRFWSREDEMPEAGETGIGGAFPAPVLWTEPWIRENAGLCESWP